MKIISKVSYLSVILIMLFISFGAITVAAENQIKLRNRGIEIELSNEIIYENEQYYISVDDLEKIDVYHEFTYSDTNNDFTLKVWSDDICGIENKITIEAEENHIVEIGSKENIYHYYYDFHITSNSKKNIPCVPDNGMSVVTRTIDNIYALTQIEDKYYISLNVISIGIAYEYKINENVIDLWISDKDYSVINGTITIPDEEISSEDIPVDILVYRTIEIVTDADIIYNNYFTQTVIIPANSASAYYYIPIMPRDNMDRNFEILFNFNSDLKSIDHSFRTTSGGQINVSTEYLAKTDITVVVCRPFLDNEKTSNIFPVLLFEGYTFYKSDTPIIKSGEFSGKITLRIDPKYVCIIRLLDVEGDDTIYDYGYYLGSNLVLSRQTADPGSGDKQELSLQRAYTISGKVTSILDNPQYKVEICYYDSPMKKEWTMYTMTDENMEFSIRVPYRFSRYKLFAISDLNIRCGYISNTESNFNGDFRQFENLQNYDNIILNYIPYTLPLPLKVESDERSAFIKNMSDIALSDLNIHIAYYNKAGQLIHAVTNKSTELLHYDNSLALNISHPEDCYKSPAKKLFVFGENLKPLSEPAELNIDKIPEPEKCMTILTDNSKNAIYKNTEIILSSAPLIRDDGMYLSIDDLAYLDLSTEYDGEKLSIFRNNKKIVLYPHFEQISHNDFGTWNDKLSCFYQNDIWYICLNDLMKLLSVDIIQNTESTITVDPIFDDIDYTHKYFDAITDGYYRGIILGYDDGSFNPESTILKSMAARMLCIIADMYCTEFPFSCDDVDSSHWASSFIGICVKENLLPLNSNRFEPNSQITTQEIINALIILNPETNQEQLMKNVDVDDLNKPIPYKHFAQVAYNFNHLTY